MTSPAGFGFPEPDILTRWTPSCTRAGVILHPSPDLAGSLRCVTAKEPGPPMPEDSFASDFAPLSASTDSSLVGADGCDQLILGDVTYRPTNGELSVPTAILKDQFHKLDTMANEDLPIMMKLDQLRKWQQEMQKQLQAHQLEELLCLQEEQQRLLGIVNDPRRLLGESPESTELSEPEWDEETVHYRPDVDSGVGKEQNLSVADGKKQLSRDHEEGMWDSKEKEWRCRVDGRGFSEPQEAQQQRTDSASAEGRIREGDQVWNDRPIRPGIVGQKQTFEELLEEQLRLEEQRLKSARQQQNPAQPKRAFLKRGEGLARFTHNSKASSKKAESAKVQKSELQTRVISRSNSAPAFIHKAFSNSSPRLPVQRKTAVLNKENQERRVCSSPREIRADGKPAWTKVLGTHQRQNTEETLKTEPESRKNRNALHGLKNDKNKAGLSDPAQRSSGPNKQPNPVTKQVGTMEAVGNADSDATTAKSSGSKVEATPLTGKGGGAPLDSFEMSFQEKLQRWECDKQLENMELGEFELLEQAAEELSFSSNSSFVTKVLRMDQQKRQLQTAQGLHQRRLSSTPIKSPPRGEPQKCGSTERDAVSVCISSSSEEKKSSAVDKVGAEDDDGEDSGREDQRELSDGGSDFGEQDVVLFPSSSNPPYDKRSYQEESFRDSEDEEGDSDHSYAGDSTLTEDKDSQQPDVIFNDDDTWSDLEVSAGGKTGDPTEVSPTPRSAAIGGKPLMRKVAASKATESDSASETDHPPASQLMTRLFPSLKPKAKNAPDAPPPVLSQSSQQSNDTVQQAQSRQLRERLVELEIEIERFKKENAALTKLRHDHQRKQEELRKERLDFDQAKAAELARFEDYKKEENRKLQKERKLFEKYASAARAAPDKKEREEIQSLKEQLNSLQEELKRRESRWTSTHTRLRQQVESLSEEKAALREEIQMLEKLRLSAWKKSSVSAAETKDSPRISESSGSSGTKGVTFASPLDSIGSCSSPPAGGSASGPRGTSKDSSAGIKSSLRRSGGSTSSFSSSSSLTSRKQEGRSSSPASRKQKLPQTLEQSEDSSAKTDAVPEQQQSIEAEEADSVQNVITHPDGKIEKVLVGGDRLIVFPNGTRKEVSADGLSAKITFFNGDTKQITADQRVIYYYAEAQTTHITYPEGLEVLHFPNNQTEKHFPDGRKEITFPDQTVKNLYPDGREESVLTDGTIIRVNTDGIKEIHFNTGQKEVHTADFKRREYPDGTVKTVYNDGRQETRYPTGRIRIKDKEGNVLMDKRT
ncbi:centromere protein J isoform X2 [Oryzias melastigma]|uniref:centromere protein J isoform X2 n=1 Tax=Oryzias melastigma TaxID=30732 RepID=UPI000CF7DAA2|nr:centromere protein J isoform X2 [Oryzias melastigma]